MATLYLEQKCRQGLTGRGLWLDISMKFMQRAEQQAGTALKRPGKPLLHWRGRYPDRQRDRRLGYAPFLYKSGQPVCVAVRPQRGAPGGGRWMGGGSD